MASRRWDVPVEGVDDPTRACPAHAHRPAGLARCRSSSSGSPISTSLSRTRSRRSLRSRPPGSRRSWSPGRAALAAPAGARSSPSRWSASRSSTRSAPCRRSSTARITPFRFSVSPARWPPRRCCRGASGRSSSSGAGGAVAARHQPLRQRQHRQRHQRIRTSGWRSAWSCRCGSPPSSSAAGARWRRATASSGAPRTRCASSTRRSRGGSPSAPPSSSAPTRRCRSRSPCGSRPRPSCSARRRRRRR